MNKVDEITEMINALEEMSCEHAFSHGQMAVKELIPKIIKVLEKEIPLTPKCIEQVDEYGFADDYYCCALCDTHVAYHRKYCSNCGRKVGERK